MNDTASPKEQILAEVLAGRAAHRARGLPARIALAAAGLVLFVVAIPVSIVLPEAGVPALLLGLRALAYEFDPAARAYAELAWEWFRVRAWFLARGVLVQTAILLALLGVIVLLVWLALSVT